MFCFILVVYCGADLLCFQTLTEGAQVDGFITAGQLVDKAVELLWPRLHQALPGFSFNLDVMVVREILTWIDLAHYAKKNTNKPFLYERCLALPRINSKPGTEKKFKTNVKPFEFALVIPPAHYQAYEETVKRKKREERKRNGRNGRNHHHSEDEDEEDLQEELDEVEEEEEPEIEYSTQWAEDIYDDVPAAAPANSQSLFTDKVLTHTVNLSEIRLTCYLLTGRCSRNSKSASLFIGRRR